MVLPAVLIACGCSMKAKTRYWGRTVPPKDNVLRYVTGSEPESLDPAFGGQPEARIFIGLYDRLVEFNPKTMAPIPSLATHWELDPSGRIYTFYLRKDGRFSNGDPIKAQDFVWSFRRLLGPELASRYGYFYYDVKYAEAFNSGQKFVRKNGEFALVEGGSTNACTAEGPECLTVPGDAESRNEQAAANPRIASALEGATLVPVSADDVALETPDDYTLRIVLRRPAPYFVALLATQYFSVLSRTTIKKYGKDWTRPENIVTSGAFKVKIDRPYDQLFVVRNPFYWDAANVHLDGIRFYPLEDFSAVLNLYKTGEVDAIYNHTVPSAWVDYMRQFKDEFMLLPEIAVMYYSFSVKKPPVDNVNLRKAFSLAIDRKALSTYLKATEPLNYFVPEGIFPEYEKIRERVFDTLRKQDGISDKDWSHRGFDPARACRLMKEAGYKVKDIGSGRCRVSGIPPRSITITYNTLDTNKQVAEFIQAQLNQNLGIEVPIENLEWRTYLQYGHNVSYKGLIRAGWVGDYIDPYAFLLVWYSKQNDSYSGWWSQKYDDLLDDANAERDPEKRLEILARAEYLMLRDQPCIPLQTRETDWLKKPYVKGMFPNPGTMHPWKFVYIERDPSKWDYDVQNIMKRPTDPKVQRQVDALKKSQIDFEKSRQAK